MFSLSENPLELITRAVLIYFFLFALLRLVGKKHVGELSPFDLLVLLIISETVQNSLVGNEKSIWGGLIASSTLVGLAQIMNYISWRNKRSSRALQGTPKILVRHGHRYDEVMRQEQVTEAELMEALRESGCTSLSSVRAAVLENNGKISIIKGRQRRRGASGSQ